MNIERLAEKLVDAQFKRPWMIIGIFLLLTAAIIPGALNIEVKPSTEAILPEDNPDVRTLDSLRAKYSGDITHIVLRSGDMARKDYFESMLRAGNRIEKFQNVRMVDSPASRLVRKYGELPGNQEIEEYEYGSLMSDDRTTAVMMVRLDTQARSGEIEEFRSRLDTVVGSEMSVDYSYTGYNMINFDTFRFIISDFSRITVVSFIAVLLVLFSVFRDMKTMFLPVIPVIFALVWMVGLGGYMGADMTIISMVSAAMIMGLGIDFGIHVTKKTATGEFEKERMYEGMKELSRGLLGGSLTTAVGFLALLFAQLTGMHSLGIFLFTGILSAYLAAVVVLPSVIIILKR